MKTKFYPYSSVIIGIKCPPSVTKQLQNILYREEVYTLEDFCQKTEKEFKEMKGMTPYMLLKINDFLKTYGLKYGMTKEEISAYQDQDYFSSHPEEKALVDAPCVEEMERVFEQDFLNNLPPEKKEKMEDENFNETVDYLPIVDPDEEQKKVAEESDEEKRLLLEDKAKARLEEIDKILFFNYDPSANIRAEEWEITIHSAAIRFMTHDSFLTKLFVSEEKRLSRAFKNAKKLYEMLREDASERGKQVQKINKDLIIERNTLRSKFPNLFNPGFHR